MQEEEKKLPEEPSQQPAPADEPKKTDGDFSARYHDAKKKDVEKLSEEIEARNSKDTRSKKIKWWIKTILLLVMIGISVGIMFGVTSLIEGANSKSFSSMLRGVDWPLFAILIAVVLLYIIFESAKYSYLLKISTGKMHIRASFKVMFLGKYYDGITPLGTGGQPFQIYYLHKKNSIPAGVATAVPLVKFTISTVVFCIMATVLFSMAPKFLPGGWGDTTLLVIAWVSMVANFLMPVGILFASLFPRAGKKLTIKIVNLLSKLRIVKHRYPTIRKYVYEIDEYRNSLKAIIRRWWLILPLLLLAFCSSLLSFSIPYFAVTAIADVEPSFELFMQMLTLSFISFYSASLIPTPGNSGALEGAASIIFATVLLVQPGVSGVIGWVILVWRFLSYYIYILSGIGINVFEIIRSAVRNRRLLKNGK